MMFDVDRLVIYRLICHILFSSASFVYFFHFAIFAFAISFVYSLTFLLHASLSISFLIFLYIFLNLLACLLSFVSCSFHQCLLCELDFLIDVNSFIVI